MADEDPLDLHQVQSVPLVEQEGTEHRVHIVVCPMLAQDISRIDVSWDVVEPCHSRGDALPGVVVAERLVSLSETGMWY